MNEFVAGMAAPQVGFKPTSHYQPSVSNRWLNHGEPSGAIDGELGWCRGAARSAAIGSM
jgi:hypothetical protein